LLLLLLDTAGREGHTELVVSLYHELYRKQRLQHWQDREALVMDLHGFGRGMAYAAVTVALKEVRMNEVVNELVN